MFLSNTSLLLHYTLQINKLRLSNQHLDLNLFLEWLLLRKEHGILGHLIGCISHLPRQDIINGLPLKLMPEEVTLILQKNIGKVYAYKDPYAARTSEVRAKYASYVEKVKKEQVCNI